MFPWIWVLLVTPTLALKTSIHGQECRKPFEERSTLRVGASLEGDVEEQDRTKFQLNLPRGWRLAFFPGSDLYPRAIADPLRPMFSLNSVAVNQSDLEGAGERRFGFRLGGRYGFLRIIHPRKQKPVLQLDVEGAFLGQFDRENQTDNIGWDGLYGVYLSWWSGGKLAASIGIKHISAHVGDEFIERTGRERINYTREAWVLGLSYSFTPNWRAYGAYGYAYDLRNVDLQRPGKAKVGLEFESPRRWWGRRTGYYVAMDATSFEENQWHTDLTLQAGLVIPVKKLARTYRFGLEFRDGRSLLGEFFQHQERHLALGFWMDL